MADMMVFPNTWEEFEKEYGFTDTEQIYTNGSRLIPSFRVKQWLDHIRANQNEPKVKESPSLVKDLVKAFCEDGTWLERQGVYTLTLVEAKQRAVDIIESVVTETEQTEQLNQKLKTQI